MNAALTTDINTVQLAISEKLGFAIQGISYFSASLIVGFYLNPRVAAILLVAIILPVAGIVVGAAKALGKYGSQEAVALSAAGKIADESIKGAHVVQALNLQNVMVRRQDTQMQYAVRSGIAKAAIGGLVLGGIFFIA